MLKTCLRLVLVLACLASGADALTIYRIGAAKAGVAEGVKFVQLDWEGVESA